VGVGSGVGVGVGSGVGMGVGSGVGMGTAGGVGCSSTITFSIVGSVDSAATGSVSSEERCPQLKNKIKVKNNTKRRMLFRIYITRNTSQNESSPASRRRFA
jgi:hypothetical protein